MFVDNISNLNEEVVDISAVKGDSTIFIADLNSVSLSLVDDINQVEIVYMSVTSSSVNWGEKPKRNKIFKPFPTLQIMCIEEQYQLYQQALSSAVAGTSDKPKQYNIGEDAVSCISPATNITIK